MCDRFSFVNYCSPIRCTNLCLKLTGGIFFREIKTQEGVERHKPLNLVKIEYPKAKSNLFSFPR